MFETVILYVELNHVQKDFDSLICLVSFEKQQRIKRFHFIQDAWNCLLGDIVARVELCRATGLSSKHLEFSTNTYGKPFLLNSPHIHFNISHAGNFIACAVADEPVGIDIELIKPIDMKIAERFFAPDEVAYIMDDDSTHRFYEVWTKKESRIKWEGKGLSIPLPSFSVFDKNRQGVPTYHFIFQNNDAICHVCSAKQTLPSVRFMDAASFIKNIV